jgi:hypothetical protein
MTTHLTKIWWDLNKHKLVEQAIPEAEIYKREWVDLTLEDAEWLLRNSRSPGHLIDMTASKLKEKNT